jgi:murein DD-endopeptidase MepM/ murein hydrolase activator NlpD
MTSTGSSRFWVSRSEGETMSRGILSIIIVPHDRGHSRTVRVSYRRLKVSAGIAVALFLGSAFVFVHYAMLLRRAEETRRVETENRDLREKVSAIEALNRRLDDYEAYVERIDLVLGIGRAGRDSSAEPAGTGAPAGTTGEVVGGTGADERPLLLLSGGSEIPSEWPLTRRGFVTRGFGLEAAGHQGIDIAVPEDTPVRATASGIVCDLGWDNVYGNYVELRHGEGYSTKYSHVSRLLVRRGQWVRKGEIIAFSGNTGRSTAPHLHYEVRLQGTAVDPHPYLLGYRSENHVEG